METKEDCKDGRNIFGWSDLNTIVHGSLACYH